MIVDADGLVARRASSVSSAGVASMSATPPPATMPSSTAARVACSASSMRCFFSLSSTSVAAPTLMTATPPDSFARRSWSFSLSKSQSEFSISALSWLMRALMSSSAPAPSMIVVFSLVTLTVLARPSIVQRHALELHAELLGDDLAAGDDGDVLEHALAAVAEARRLDGDGGERAAQLVEHERRRGPRPRRPRR